MKYIVDHPKGYRHAITVCIKNQIPFIFNSEKEVVLTGPTKIGINTLIKAGAKVSKPGQVACCQVESQPEDVAAPIPATKATFPQGIPQRSSQRGGGRMSRWFQSLLDKY